MDVGISLNMSENVSSVAPKISTALRGISGAGEEIKAALDLSDLEKQYQKFAERVDKIHDIQKQNKQLASTTSPAQPKPTAGVGVGTATSAIRSGGRIASSLGSGDIGSAANDALATMGGIAKAAGPIGAVVAVVGAVAFAGNALSKQYEKHMNQIMNVNNILDRFGDTAIETSENFRGTMNEISSASARYGYTLMEGMNVYKQLIKESGTATAEEARDVMFFQRWGGFEGGELSQFRGRGARFGMGNQELLGNAYGTMEQSGMEKGLFGEFMSSTLSIFEDGLARGVVRGFNEINELQSRIGGMGAQFQGQYGMNLLKTMDTRAAGATGLQSQGDLIMFNAARNMLESKGQATDYISVQKALEGGMTQDLLGNVYSQVKMRSGGVQPDMIELLKEIMPGLTYTTAEALLKELETGKKISTTYGGPGGQMRGADELSLLSTEEEFANVVRNLGKETLVTKVALVEGLIPAVKTLGEVAEASGDKRIEKEKYKEWKNWVEGSEFRENMTGIGMDTSRFTNPFLHMSSYVDRIMKNPNQYPSGLSDVTQQFGYAIDKAPNDLLKYLGNTQFLDQLMTRGENILSPGEKQPGKFSEYDMGMAVEMLVEAIGNFNKTVAEEKQISITNIMGE